MSDFQQTVDLREKMERSRRSPTPKPSSPAGGKAVNQLEKIYQDEDPIKPKEDLKTISRPKIKESREGLIKFTVFILAILVVGAAIYGLFFRNKGASVDSKIKNWYAITLKDNNMTYYGQIFDEKANPVVINNVYYDYDQNEAINNNKQFVRTGDLRLVKQGKEPYGPESITSVYQSNISTLTPLKADSKVLQAILEYEK